MWLEAKWALVIDELLIYLSRYLSASPFQGSREVERKEARQNQQPYNRNLSTPHSFRQNRSRSGGQGQDYESVFQDYEKELTQQGRPSQPMQEFQQQQQQQHRAVHSDRLSFGKGRSERSSFGRAGHVADPSFGRDQYDGEQSGGDWQMRRDYSQQPGLLGDPPATFDRGDSEFIVIIVTVTRRIHAVPHLPQLSGSADCCTIILAIHRQWQHTCMHTYVHIDTHTYT